MRRFYLFRAFTIFLFSFSLQMQKYTNIETLLLYDHSYILFGIQYLYKNVVNLKQNHAFFFPENWDGLTFDPLPKP